MQNKMATESNMLEATDGTQNLKLTDMWMGLWEGVIMNPIT